MKFLLIVLSLLSCSQYQEAIADKIASTSNEPEKKVQFMNEPEDDAKNLKKIHEMFNDYKTEFKTVRNILPKEALSLKDAIYVDVRDEKEIKVSQIKNSITKKQLLDNLENYKDKKIISYCTIGYRSGKFTETLMGKKIEAYNLKGGLLLWSHENLQVYNNDLVTNQIHVYDSPWDLLKSGYVAIY